MISKLKDILNTYSDEELKDMEIWINSINIIDSILINKYNINLITTDIEIKLNDCIEKESN